MSVDSTAELLFNISANADQATANLEAFRNVMATDLSFMTDEFAQFSETAAQEQLNLAMALQKTTAAETEQVAATEALAVAHGHAVSEIQATSGAIRLLEGSGGIRAMERFTVTTLGLGPAMQAIFPVVGAIAFLEIIVRMGEEGYKLAQKWDLVHQAELRAEETSKVMGAEIQKIGEEINKLDAEALERAIGKPAATINEASNLINTKIAADRQMIAALQLDLQHSQDLINAVKTDFAHETRQGIQAAAASMKDVGTIREQLTAFQMDLEKNERIVTKLIAEGSEAQLHQNESLKTTTKEATTNFTGLSSVLESIKNKIAANGTEWDRLANEIAHFHAEAAKAQDELKKLERSGSVTAASVQRETAALAQIPAMISRVVAETSANIRAAEVQRWGEAVTRSAEAQEEETYQVEKAGAIRVEVSREITDKLAAQSEQGYAQERARWIEQQNAWAANLSKKTALTADDWNTIDLIAMDGIRKIDRTEASAWQQEIAKLQEHLDSLIAANSTAEQRITAEHQKALEQQGAAEDAALRKVAGDEAQANQIRQMYAQINTQLTQKYQNDLQTLLNSQGWQGVFGSHFAQGIQQNKQLMQQWATSTNQSILMVQVTLETLEEQAKKTFDSFVQGMGSSITQAFITQKSIGAAMRQVLESTLESIAGQAAVQAIYASALGFLDLAEQNYPGASAAFTSAAIFGSVAAAAAVTGRALNSSSAPSGGGAGSGWGSGSGSGSGSMQAGSVAGSGGQPQQGTVTINIAGHVIGPSGTAQLIDMINQAVYGNDVTLYASHTKSGVPLR